MEDEVFKAVHKAFETGTIDKNIAETHCSYSYKLLL